MFIKFRTINKGKKDYHCYLCDKLIPIGDKHTYGVTSDISLMVSKGKVATGRFCIKCIAISA